MSKKTRLLVAKIGLDGHDRGVKILARAFRDAGFEVIYSGLHQTPEMIANMAVQEAVDAVGVSILSGAHNRLLPELAKILADKGANEIKIFGGGIIPEKDIALLKKSGVKEVFLPGTTLGTIIDWVKENI
ncbi:MAG: methylmalonyl-CoA mutase [Deltaproteobacteria bacterium CG11_big_fil_rev_8_21_14_0_20_49_13]|nr:MAG: methylmalonyl-CoA mutase [Deltaproteobacteria bacterium CG11_big_fil_rev_8_21_14_0_20_49_13]